MWETFSTVCPFCGYDGNIQVIQVKLSSTGNTLDLNVPLRTNGFEIYSFHDPNEKDLSTEDERVQCYHCKIEFALSLLLLSMEQAPDRDSSCDIKAHAAAFNVDKTQEERQEPNERENRA